MTLLTIFGNFHFRFLYAYLLTATDSKTWGIYDFDLESLRSQQRERGSGFDLGWLGVPFLFFLVCDFRVYIHKKKKGLLTKYLSLKCFAALRALKTDAPLFVFFGGAVLFCSVLVCPILSSLDLPTCDVRRGTCVRA